MTSLNRGENDVIYGFYLSMLRRHSFRTLERIQSYQPYYTTLIEGEMDGLTERFSRLQQEHENQLSSNQQLEVEVARKSSQLHEKEDLEVQLRQIESESGPLDAGPLDADHLTGMYCHDYKEHFKSTMSSRSLPLIHDILVYIFNI